MNSNRLEAFSDGVIAIIITIMVLELKVPHGDEDAAAPSELYGVVLLMAAVAYWILQHSIIVSQGPDSLLKAAVGKDWKGRLSPPLYLLGIAAAGFMPRLAQAIYALGALVWLVPDRRIETKLARDQPAERD
jgi:uncharacterized membrane protein